MKWENKQQSEGWWTRYGNVVPFEQASFAHDESKISFHAAPARVGLYAFPRGYEEPFLLSSDGSNSPDRLTQRSFYLKDSEGKRFNWKDEVNESYNSTLHKYERIVTPEVNKALNKVGYRTRDIFEVEGFICVMKKPHVFRYEGELWHHLKKHTPEDEVIDTHGSWVKSSFGAWSEAFRRTKHEDLKYIRKDSPQARQLLHLDPYKHGRGGFISRDHLEVFFQRVKR